MLTREVIEQLEQVFAEVPTVRLTFGISVYLDKPLSEVGSQVVQAHDRFLQLVGKDALRFYANLTMTKHKPVNAKTFGMVPAWFAPKAPSADMFGIEIHDGEVFNAAPHTMFEISGFEEVKGQRAHRASLVRFVLPPSWGSERAADALDLTRELCALLPFRSGHAGFGFECSRYFPKDAHEHAFAQCMRHPGIDIHNSTNDIAAVGLANVRGVNWLTMLDDAFVKQLGGPPKLTKGSVILVKGGVILKAQDAPAIGDVNKKDDLPAYREVFRYVEPLIGDAFERSPWLSMHKDSGDKTERFYKRLA